MTRIADLLDRDFSRPVAETVKVDNDDLSTVLMELTEYVATDRIEAEYERLFSAMAATPKSLDEGVGVWISGPFGSGKSSFAKNLGYVLANRDVDGASASSLFLRRVKSSRVAECVEILNRTVPCEIFMVDAQRELPPESHPRPIAEVMYKALLRGLEYAEDGDISALEIQLEKEGRLAPFQDLCRTEYKEEWRDLHQGRQALARTSALLHRFDSRTYSSADTWLNAVKARDPGRLAVEDLVEKSFALCEIRRRGDAFAFIVDEGADYGTSGGENLEDLCAIVAQFGRESIRRLNAGVPRHVWIILTGRETPREVCNSTEAAGLELSVLERRFPHQVDLSNAGIDEVAIRRVLRKNEGGESILRKLFRDHGASLMQNLRLERCSRRTEFDEDQFIRCYPYPPHLIDLSIDILAGIRLQPNASKYVESSNRTIVKQFFEMLVSDRTRLADGPVGALVSLDKVYQLVEGNLSWEKQKSILDIRQRFDDHADFPAMASRVAKVICLVGLVKPGLPCTTKNIAALLVERTIEVPRAAAVAAVLERLQAAQFVHETEDGWELYDFDGLRRATAALGWLGKAVGNVNPRTPGWRNDLIQGTKRLVARSLNWYTRPLREFNASVSRSLEEIVSALDHISRNMVALDHLSMNAPALECREIADKSVPQLLDHLSINMVALDQLSTNVVALEWRLAQSERRNAMLAASTQEQLNLLRETAKALAGLPSGANVETLMDTRETHRANSGFSVDHDERRDRTTYVLGLFGTGRRYINDLMLKNIGERAKYFRDTIRLHPGPTSMIYSGHATMRYVSRAQEPPAVMSRIVEALGSGFADSIFVYRHPLDSLLTNWVWWRTYIRENRTISGISQVYKNRDELCGDLEEHFSDFKAFAEGDPEFFAGLTGPRFLSFPEFVEETGLHLRAATLALRLEDFMVDPPREFSRIVELMSLDLDLSRLSLVAPRTTPYTYLAVQEKVPRFRSFITGLDVETWRRIEAIGYEF